MMDMLYVSETSQFMFFGSGKWWLTNVFGVRYFQTNPLYGGEFYGIPANENINNGDS